MKTTQVYLKVQKASNLKQRTNMKKSSSKWKMKCTKLTLDLGNLQVTMKVLEEEKTKIENMTETEKQNYVLDPYKFNKLRKKQIEKVYGDLGEHMLKMLP
jgi:hypothetical protein